MFDVQRDIDQILSIKCLTLERPEICPTFLNSASIKVLTFNIRSIQRNFNDFSLMLSRLNIEFDVLILTECWLTEFCIIPEIRGYNAYRTKNSINKCSGVIAYVKNIWSPLVQEPYCDECNYLAISMGDIFILGVYRSPSFTNTDKFLSSLNHILGEHKNTKITIVAGDCNLNILEDKPSASLTDYTCLMAEHQLIPAITEPTRIKACLDHIYVKSKHSIPIGLVCRSSVTDHDICICGIKAQCRPQRRNNKQRRKINTADLIAELTAIDWSIVLESHDTTTAVDSFLKLLNNAIDNHSKLVTIKRPQNCLKAWITPGLLRCQRTRDKLHLQARKNPNNPIIQYSYKRYRNFLKELLNRVKATYYNSKITEFKSNPKKLWATIKEDLSTNKAKQAIKNWLMDLNYDETEKLLPSTA
ncbi:hypothetical protein ACJJTC_018939 [Scirpophaga incertulas]